VECYDGTSLSCVKERLRKGGDGRGQMMGRREVKAGWESWKMKMDEKVQLLMGVLRERIRKRVGAVEV
jgi:hypothetical protein